MSDVRTFFRCVIPSVLAFAFSGVYSIVDGYFVGNCVGDAGLSAINIAYPVTAFIQAAGTGIGMGGAVYYSIFMAEGKEKRARDYTAGALWLLLAAGVIFTVLVCRMNGMILRLLGAEGEILSMGIEYIAVIAAGAALQIIGTGLVPFMRNCGGAFWAMGAMTAGFLMNIVLDYLFVWVLGQGAAGAAAATVTGQGMTMAVGLVYLMCRHKLTLKLSPKDAGRTAFYIIRVGIAPFGLAMSPNLSLIFVNRFSMAYGGEPAVAAYACISYAIWIIYLVLQGVGDGSQPLFSRFYGGREYGRLIRVRRMAYASAMILAVSGMAVLYVLRENLGRMFGTSDAVNSQIAEILPVFLVAVPFVAVSRVTTAAFYATEKGRYSYILTFMEPVLMLGFMLTLPPLFGGQAMIWRSTVYAGILTALTALALKLISDRRMPGRKNAAAGQ